jgi:hypothetical protein
MVIRKSIRRAAVTRYYKTTVRSMLRHRRSSLSGDAGLMIAQPVRWLVSPYKPVLPPSTPCVGEVFWRAPRILAGGRLHSATHRRAVPESLFAIGDSKLDQNS